MKSLLLLVVLFAISCTTPTSNKIVKTHNPIPLKSIDNSKLDIKIVKVNRFKGIKCYELDKQAIPLICGMHHKYSCNDLAKKGLFPGHNRKSKDKFSCMLFSHGMSCCNACPKDHPESVNCARKWDE